MKTQMTKKQVMNGHEHVISVPYCHLQNLLTHYTATGYYANAEGWRADIYTFGNVAIVTGYGNFGNIQTSYEVNHRYDKKADAIWNNWSMAYEIKLETLHALVEQYIAEVVL